MRRDWQIAIINDMMIKCEIYQDEEATVEVTYGLYSEYKKGRPHYVHNLCQQAAKELWDTDIHMLVNMGKMHWTNKIL